jgi:hypothetical protein
MTYRITYLKSDMPKAEAPTKEVKGLLKKSGPLHYNEVRARFAAAAGRHGLVFRDKVKGNDGDLHEMLFGLDEQDKNSDVVAIVNTSAVHIVYYTPFPCMFRQVEGLYQAKAGYAVVKHNGKTQPLAQFGPHAIFYVVGHGDRSGGELTCDCHKCGSKFNMGGGLTAWELWDRVKADGLPENPACIRLWACLGADPPADDPAGKSFAALFRNAAVGDEEFETGRTFFQSFNGYLTMTKDGGYSYTEKGNDATKVRAMDRLRTIAKPQVRK